MILLDFWRSFNLCLQEAGIIGNEVVLGANVKITDAINLMKVIKLLLV